MESNAKEEKESNAKEELRLEILDGKERAKNSKCYQNVLAICPELYFLHFKLKSNNLVRLEDLKIAVV